ncbi:EID1-like F-box protein 3 [Apostasia shenzhenica]|uniref:EID1-like F-box protein 3 n=1 Tax=Apostasia shenzhenica TaxID=1088818 RepID=A0A2I0BGC2_9ASPA|nr:EID1-like F-box protein 3 [Apostasia shenzhenica]
MFSPPRAPKAAASRAAGCSGAAPLAGWRCADDVNTGIQDERVLMLVFERLNWDPHVICVTACVSRRLRAVAGRVLWREACISRAPRVVAALTWGSPAGPGRVGGGWHALAKLLFYCCGGLPSRNFPLPGRLPGHFAGVSRFSKTSGRSFLSRRCWGDLLYVSDPCEHVVEWGAVGEDLGAYRGVFRGFMRSRTRAWLIARQLDLEQRVRCPYCGARVWSMTAARLAPKSAARRLGSRNGQLEYFVCVNGHLHGNCWLAHLSTDDDGGGLSGGGGGGGGGGSSDEDDDGGGYDGRHIGDDDEEDDEAHIAC